MCGAGGAPGQVGKDAVEVAGLLHAIPNARQLVGEVRAARLGGIKVALDRQADAAAHDAVAVTAAQRGAHARDTLIGHALEKAHVKADLVPFHRGLTRTTMPSISTLCKGAQRLML